MIPFKTRVFRVCCLLLSTSAVGGNAAPGQPGTLDATWGGTGQVVTNVSGNSHATAMTLQPDGKVLLAGYCTGSGNADFCVTRYNADGTLDLTWNGTGKVVTTITPRVSRADDFARAMAVQPDGKILLAGRCGGFLCTMRFQANGASDSSWNFGSSMLTTAGGGTGAAMALQPDGKVLLAGDCQNTSVDFCVARLDAATCAMDLDGDTKVLATIDSLMHIRIALGLTNTAVTNGIIFPAATPRNDWTSISNYLVDKTLDIDGLTTAAIDSLIHARVALGVTGNAVVNGITFPANATRNTWPLIRDYLVTQCGMTLVQ